MSGMDAHAFMIFMVRLTLTVKAIKQYPTSVWRYASKTWAQFSRMKLIATFSD